MDVSSLSPNKWRYNQVQFLITLLIIKKLFSHNYPNKTLNVKNLDFIDMIILLKVWENTKILYFKLIGIVDMESLNLTKIQSQFVMRNISGSTCI